MKTRIKQLVLLPALMGGLALIPASRVTAQTLVNLYSFPTTVANSSYTIYSNSGGAYPDAGLILSGNTLYGTAQSGGTNGTGTVFAVNTDGTGFTVLHTFGALVSGTNSDGAHPVAPLLQDGNLLYGTAQNGGSSGNGTVFALSTDGPYFTNLHSFTALSAPFGGTNSDGANPAGGLTLAEFVTLYGTAQNGGTNGTGTVFALTGNGSNFTTITTLHTFTTMVRNTGANSDGAAPAGAMLLSGNTLYGTASGGGSGGNGTVFALNVDGTGYTNLYNFSAYTPVYINNIDGAQPNGGLVLSGNSLYGTTHSGGTNDAATVFGVTTNGTDFTVVYSFTGNSDGANPYAGLFVSGNTLFGTAGNGGDSYDGTVFSVTTNGADFTTLHAFTNTPDGGSPHAALLLSGITLYGTAESGGTNGSGMVFSLPLSVPPELTITLSGPAVILTWPTNATGFALQTTTNLDSPIVWTNEVPAAVAGNMNYAVTNSISDTARFYRLSQ